MFGASSISGWGMAPSKTRVEPESLGFGFAKMCHSGFMNVVYIFIPKLVQCINEKSLESFTQNGFKNPLNMDVIRDYIKSLKHDQISIVGEQLSGFIFKATIGAGSTVVCPSGWIVCEKTMLGASIGTRIVFQTVQTEPIDTYNALRPKGPSPVVVYPG